MITTRGTLLVAICFLGPSIACQQPPSDDYVLGADSKPRAGIPAGKTLYFDITDSKVFPNSRHTITVYVPAAYRGDKPACVYVGLDGLGFGASQVFDNLIAQKAMPVTIGIGVSSGSVDSAQPPENPRFDRSFEFDNLNDRLARFLLDEVLPAVEEQKTTDSRPILLSKNPNDRSIGGGSTGGIAAFNVAWQRPEEFRRVFTAIGTFVGMRGGEQFYVLVRKTEPKPLRIFMQDGVNDEWGGGPEIGDWWMSNQTMERALSFAGYDVRHVWGTGAHSDRHAASLFPDAMRWLWRDWPEPVVAHPPGNPVLQSILDESSKWEVVAKQCGDKAFLAAGPNGQIYVSRAGASQADAAFPIAEQPETQSCAHSGIEDPVAFTADGQPVLAAKEARALGKGFHVDGLTVCSNKDVYLTAQAPDGAGQIWRISADGKKTQLDRGLEKLSGIALSPDGLWLMAARADSGIAYSYRVREDGSIDAREPFYYVQTLPGQAVPSEAGSIWMDADGRPYVATDLGVQVFDRNGRVTAIMPLPNHAGVTGISFGGKDWKTLYAAGGGTIFRRRMKAPGVPPWTPGIKLPKWGAG